MGLASPFTLDCLTQYFIAKYTRKSAKKLTIFELKKQRLTFWLLERIDIPIDSYFHYHSFDVEPET